MPEQNELTQAFSEGNMEKAKELLRNGAKLPTLDDYRKSTIFETILKNKGYDVIDQLLEDGTIEADLYEYDSFDKSIFKSIIRYMPVDEESLAFLKRILTKIQNINSDVKDQTLLGYAFQENADVEIIQCFVHAGCSIDYKNNAEENFIHSIVEDNALHMRRENKALEYLHFLLRAGLDVNAENIVGKTPLIMTVEGNKPSYLPVLLENGADPNHQDKSGNTAFYYAVVHKMSLPIYETLAKFSTPRFDLVNKDGEAILPNYVKMISRGADQELSLLQRMLQDGADLAQTSLYYSKPKSALDWAAEKNAVVLQAILQAGNVDVNGRDNEGNTLLHKVCAYDVNYDKEAAKETYRKVKLLIELGADVDLTNDKDETALMMASNDNLKSKTVELLLSKKS